MGTKQIVQDDPLKSPLPGAGAQPPVISAPAIPPLPIEPQPEPGDGAPCAEPATSPAWASDLRQLYNAVVEEPLPDSFMDLLAQLDSED